MAMRSPCCNTDLTKPDPHPSSQQLLVPGMRKVSDSMGPCKNKNKHTARRRSRNYHTSASTSLPLVTRVPTKRRKVTCTCLRAKLNYLNF